MPLSNVVYQALPEFANRFLSGARIPDISQFPNGSAEFSEGTRKLVRWLKQAGFTDLEINAKTPLQWNDLKINKFDFGIGFRTAAEAAEDLSFR